MWRVTVPLVIGMLIGPIKAQRFLSVVGNELRLNGDKVFLSGMNIAWHEYGYDFGEERYGCHTGAVLENYLKNISDKGGNSIRIWIHMDGRQTPLFDDDGYVLSTDFTGSLVSDLSRFLDAAEANNILVIPVLWNGAVTMGQQLRGLVLNDDRLQSYIDTVLVPLVQALKYKVALGSWEIINEPEGSVLNNAADSNPCFDTRPLVNSGAGWTGENIPMHRFQRFINWQIAAIKDNDGKAIATQGSWNEVAQSDNLGPNARNYYKDQCLMAAGGRSGGTVDFYQMHTYEYGGSYSSSSPMLNHNNIFNLDKPNVIGEFSQDGGDGRDIVDYMEHLYTQGYAGAWTWQANGGGYHSDDFETQARGTEHLRGRTGPGGVVDIELD